MNRETVKLKTEVVKGKLCFDYDSEPGETGSEEQAEHDALYAHALVQAIAVGRETIKGAEQEVMFRAFLHALEATAEALMREWGAK